MRGLLFDCDIQVAQWAFHAYKLQPIMIDRAIGILDDEKNIVGAVLFHYYNGVNVHLSYYGKGTLTPGIVRAIARFGLHELRLARCTLVVPKRPRHILKKLLRMGCFVEGVQRRYFGAVDSPGNAGVRLVLFREKIEQLAAFKHHKVA